MRIWAVWEAGRLVAAVWFRLGRVPRVTFFDGEEEDSASPPAASPELAEVLTAAEALGAAHDRLSEAIARFDDPAIDGDEAAYGRVEEEVLGPAAEEVRLADQRLSAALRAAGRLAVVHGGRIYVADRGLNGGDYPYGDPPATCTVTLELADVVGLGTPA